MGTGTQREGGYLESIISVQGHQKLFHVGAAKSGGSGVSPGGGEGGITPQRKF